MRSDAFHAWSVCVLYFSIISLLQGVPTVMPVIPVCYASLGRGTNNGAMAEIPNEPLEAPPCLPRPVPGNKQEVNRGGYDCNFVEKQPQVFQTECPICLLILKEPCLISCCGHKLCCECIKPVKKDAKPCPLCKEPNFILMRELGLERTLKGLEVWCSHRNQGCEWRGDLGKLDEHLNQDPPPENQLNGCKFVAVECTYKCGQWFQRCDIATHQNEQCMKRPYSCDYCQDYASTFEDVTEIHYPQCGKYPVACPNGCDVYKMERQDLEGHLHYQCLLTLVHCPFNYAGCKTQLPRKDMAEHMAQIAMHLMFLSTFTQWLFLKTNKLAKENQQLKKWVLQREDEAQNSMQAVQASFQKLKKENQELQQSIQKLEMEKEQQYRELSHKQKIANDNIQSLKEKGQELKLDLQQYINSSECLLEFCVNYTEEEAYSPAFYTHPHGYRMCVRVDPKGIVNGKGTHVSIFTYMMCGPFDDYLKWPFRGEITIQIVNQAGDHDHFERIIPYNDTAPDKSAGRVTGSERPATNAWGFDQFLSHADLDYNAARKTQYLKDNHLIIRVVKVILTD